MANIKFKILDDNLAVLEDCQSKEDYNEARSIYLEAQRINDVLKLLKEVSLEEEEEENTYTDTTS